MNRTQLTLLIGILFGGLLQGALSSQGRVASDADWLSCFNDYEKPKCDWYDYQKPSCDWHNAVWCDAPIDTSLFDVCCFTTQSKLDDLIEENTTLESKLEELTAVVEGCCFTMNSKLDALCSDDWCLDEECSDVDMCFCGVCGEKRTNFVFTAPDMNKNGQNPDTSFSNIYVGGNFNLQAWKMFQGSNVQQEISLLFGLPYTCDTLNPFEVTLYLLVQKNSGSSGDKGNIRIRIDSKDTLQELGPDFIMTITTGDFAITEPLQSKKLQTLIVKKEFYAPALIPGGLLVFVFDRVLPTACTDNKCPVCTQDYSKDCTDNKCPVCTQDYSKEIFLESVVFSFYENECL